MSPRRVGRTRPCGSADARARLRQARLYLEVATLVASDEPGEHATVATANAVLAGIAAADAMCCAIAGGSAVTTTAARPSTSVRSPAIRRAPGRCAT